MIPNPRFDTKAVAGGVDGSSTQHNQEHRGHIWATRHLKHSRFCLSRCSLRDTWERMVTVNIPLAFSYLAIFQVLSQFGLTKLLVRNIARNKQDVSKYITSALVITSLLSVVAFVLMWLEVRSSGYPFETSLTILIIGLSLKSFICDFCLPIGVQGLREDGIPRPHRNRGKRSEFRLGVSCY